MSTRWHIHCLDCDDGHHFENANRMESAMLALIKHRHAIAALDPLARDQEFSLTFEIWGAGAIDTSWFVKHAGHHLRPKDEYGRLLGQCGEYVTCGECSSRHHCALEHGHEPPCSQRPARRTLT
jgi:hypothetical protein